MSSYKHLRHTLRERVVASEIGEELLIELENAGVPAPGWMGNFYPTLLMDWHVTRGPYIGNVYVEIGRASDNDPSPLIKVYEHFGNEPAGDLEKLATDRESYEVDSMPHCDSCDDEPKWLIPPEAIADIKQRLGIEEPPKPVPAVEPSIDEKARTLVREFVERCVCDAHVLETNTHADDCIDLRLRAATLIRQMDSE